MLWLLLFFVFWYIIVLFSTSLVFRGFFFCVCVLMKTQNMALHHMFSCFNFFFFSKFDVFSLFGPRPTNFCRDQTPSSCFFFFSFFYSNFYVVYFGNVWSTSHELPQRVRRHLVYFPFIYILIPKQLLLLVLFFAIELFLSM